MEFLTKVWNWFNGKKTVIGLLIVSIASQPFFHAWINNPNVIDAFMWAGGILSGAGLVHKATKGLAKANGK